MIAALLPIGIALTLLGLCGLGYCIVTAARARGAGLSEEEIRAKLQRLLAVNLGSLGLAAIGLMTVIIALALG